MHEVSNHIIIIIIKINFNIEMKKNCIHTMTIIIIRMQIKSTDICIIIESVDSISRDERDAPLMQYITNAGITRARYTSTHFKHHHRVLRLIPIE